MNHFQSVVSRIFLTSLLILPLAGFSQASFNAGEPGSSVKSYAIPPVDFTYVRPSLPLKLHRLAVDTAGPLALTYIVGSAGAYQVGDSPPEWHQDLSGFGMRLGSAAGIQAT